MKNRKDQSLYPLFLITINESDYDKIKKMQYLGLLSVRVEDYVPPRDTKQCYNCQRFDHTSHRCRAHARCFKCGGSHTSRACTIEKEQLVKKCPNCSQQHLAMYKGCPAYKQANRARAARLIAHTIRTQTQQGIPTNLPVFTNEANFPKLKPIAQPRHKTNHSQQNEHHTNKPIQKEHTRVHKLKYNEHVNTHTSKHNRIQTTQTTHNEQQATNNTQKQTPQTPQLDRQSQPSATDFAQMIREACALASDIASGNIALRDAFGKVAKSVGDLMSMSLVIAQTYDG